MLSSNCPVSPLLLLLLLQLLTVEMSDRLVTLSLSVCSLRGGRPLQFEALIRGAMACASLCASSSNWWILSKRSSMCFCKTSIIKSLTVCVIRNFFYRKWTISNWALWSSYSFREDLAAFFMINFPANHNVNDMLKKTAHLSSLFCQLLFFCDALLRPLFFPSALGGGWQVLGHLPGVRCRPVEVYSETHGLKFRGFAVFGCSFLHDRFSRQLRKICWFRCKILIKEHLWNTFP